MSYRLTTWEISPENTYCEVEMVQGEYTALRELGLAWEQSPCVSDWIRGADVGIARAYSWELIEFWRFEEGAEDSID